jgi:hypothetical protein
MKDKKEIVAKGSFITYINFTKVYKFDLQDGYVLRLPVEINQKPLKQFVIEAEVERGSFKEEDVIKKVQDFVNWLSLFFDVPSEGIELKEIVSEDSKEKKGSSVRSLSTMGSLGVEDTEISKFADIIKTNELNNRHKYCLDLFRRARLMDDLYGNYWQLYVVFIILLYDPNDSRKERKQIDENLKHYAPEMKRIHNDYDNGEWCLFIAIRDSFSHKAQFSGEELDIDKELNENMEEFIKIARNIILDKLGVDV